MPSLVLDTHSLIWYTTADPRLSPKAKAALAQSAGSGDLIYIPPICMVECVYLVEKGRIPAAGLEAILAALASPGSALKLAAVLTSRWLMQFIEFLARRFPICPIG